MSGKEFLNSVDKVFDNAANILKLNDYLAEQIKSPNSTYKLNFGVKLETEYLLLLDLDVFTQNI